MTRRSMGQHALMTMTTTPEFGALPCFFIAFCFAPAAPSGRMGVPASSKMQPRFDMAQIRKAPFGGSQHYRIAQDALEVSALERIPAIKAMRTRSERLAACVFIIRLAR